VGFEIGSRVIVRSFGNKRGLVIEAGRGRQYRVRIENAVLSCREDDLAPATDEARARERKRGREHVTRRERHLGPRRGDDRAAPPRRVDLHGLTVEEALAKVIEAIDRALQQNADRLEVLHGKGTGRIREALHRELASIPVVAAFKLDPKNPGVTWIYL
jgi:DNA-nicking Smr family endonuclease